MLLKTLQGILMILPICKSFTSLKTRLSCVKLAPISTDVEVQEEMQLEMNRFFGTDYNLEGEMSIKNFLAIFDEK
jgi:hypothetical protein